MNNCERRGSLGSPFLPLQHGAHHQEYYAPGPVARREMAPPAGVPAHGAEIQALVESTVDKKLEEVKEGLKTTQSQVSKVLGTVDTVLKTMEKQAAEEAKRRDEERQMRAEEQVERAKTNDTIQALLQHLVGTKRKRGATVAPRAAESASERVSLTSTQYKQGQELSSASVQLTVTRATDGYAVQDPVPTINHRGFRCQLIHSALVDGNEELDLVQTSKVLRIDGLCLVVKPPHYVPRDGRGHLLYEYSVGDIVPFFSVKQSPAGDYMPVTVHGPDGEPLFEGDNFVCVYTPRPSCDMYRRIYEKFRTHRSTSPLADMMPEPCAA